ncbi:MAG TPA: alpha/beta fold hydrolase [Pseudonocardia sp.]|nr:alpha/beta fold hydrolase [Pseudonocardia sp.]
MIKVNFERRGSGTPLVLLHGVGHRWQAWRPVLDELAERHDVIALDLPGFGLSPGLPAGRRYDLPSSMEMLAEVFEMLGVERPHIAGNSLGGLLSVEAASRGLVRSATLLSPAGFWNDADRRRALTMLRVMRLGARGPRFTTDAIANNARLRASSMAVLYAHPGRIDRITAMADTAALRNAPAFTPTLRAGRGLSWHGMPPAVPVTVAWGDRDRILPPRQALRAAMLLPGANHVTLPDCGHVPMIDAPALIARTILDTCVGVDSAARGVDGNGSVGGRGANKPKARRKAKAPTSTEPAEGGAAAS